MVRRKWDDDKDSEISTLTEFSKRQRLKDSEIQSLDEQSTVMETLQVNETSEQTDSLVDVRETTEEEYLAKTHCDQSHVGAHNLTKPFSEGRKFRASKKAIIPFVVLALLGGIAALFPELILSILINPTELIELKEQSEGVANALPMILKIMFYGFSIVFLVFGFKQINHGTIQIFDSYILHKQGLMKKTKILYQDLPAIEVHKASLSSFFDLGHLEITTSRKEIQINNLENPFEIKELIMSKINIKK